jgi:hypothetical protein
MYMHKIHTHSPILYIYITYVSYIAQLNQLGALPAWLHPAATGHTASVEPLNAMSPAIGTEGLGMDQRMASFASNISSPARLFGAAQFSLDLMILMGS